MNTFYQRSFTLFLVIGFLLASSVTARPTTQQRSSSRAISTPFLRTDDEKTIKTVQVYTMFGGNTTEICTLISSPTTTTNGGPAIVVSKNCSFTFIPSTLTSPPSTSVPILSTASPSEPLTTRAPSSAPASTDAVILSMFTTDALPESTSMSPTKTIPYPSSTVTTTSNPVAQATATRNVPVNDTGPSIVPSESTPLPLPTTASSTTSTDPFTSTAQSHLSSLPIFLGAFGGIAGLALLIVGFKVYHPIQRLNEMRLQPPAFLRGMKNGSGFCRSRKHWWRDDNEKLTGRPSQEIQTQSGQTDQRSSWIS